MTKNTLITIGIALIVGAGIGYAGAAYQYSATLNKVKALFPVQPMTTFVSGTIQSISGDTITIQTPQSPNPFVTTPATREVTVTSSTKIVKTTPKDPAVFQQEMLVYQKAMQKSATSTATAMPTPVTQTTLVLSDLKAGDMVMVDAGKDISTATSFDAVSVTVTGTAMTIPPAGAANGTAPVVNAAPSGSANGGTAPIVNTPPPPNPNGTAPIVNSPPPVKK